MPAVLLRGAPRILWFLACCAVLAALAVGPAAAEPVGVTVRNESVAATCAETDNVTLALVADNLEGFRITARHPAYAAMLQADSTAPDFETCDFSRDPVVPAPAAPPEAAVTAPKRITLYETADLWLVGFTFPTFWRPASVPVSVGGAVTQGLHMIQLWVRRDDRAEEVLVAYPPDGYWRARPLAPARLGSSAYGSSFLVGPVEQAERPLVRLKEIAFAPQSKTFTLYFADGGKARMEVARLDREAITLTVAFEGAAPKTFAALRSMYVTEGNADVARVAWRTRAGAGPSGGAGRAAANGATMGEAPVLAFDDARDVAMLWAGRLVPSRHNTSAPDYLFDGFSGR